MRRRGPRRQNHEAAHDARGWQLIPDRRRKNCVQGDLAGPSRSSGVQLGIRPDGLFAVYELDDCHEHWISRMYGCKGRNNARPEELIPARCLAREAVHIHHGFLPVILRHQKAFKMPRRHNLCHPGLLSRGRREATDACHMPHAIDAMLLMNVNVFVHVHALGQESKGRLHLLGRRSNDPAEDGGSCGQISALWPKEALAPAACML